MYRSVTRVYKVPPQARGDLQAFLDRLSKHIRTPIASISVRGDTIRVELSGTLSQIRDSTEALRRFFEEYKVKVGKKVRVITFHKMENIAGTGAPIDALEELIKLKGFPARRRAKKSIETTAPKKVVEEAVRKLVEAYGKVRDERISSSAMKMVIVVSAYLELDPSQVIEEAMKMNILFKDSNGKIRTGYAWRGALREFMRAYRKEAKTEEGLGS